MATCERCGAVVTAVGHRHRVNVRVPIQRVTADGVRHASFERVTVVADAWAPGGAILRAVARVHGRGATWIDGGRWHGPDRGCVGHWRRGMDVPMHDHCDVPAPVIEWDGGDL